MEALAKLRAVVAAVVVAAATVVPASVSAQGTVLGGDFDICDYCGNLRANTAFLVGRSGFGTQTANFILINADKPEQDVDNDGWTVGIDFTSLNVVDTASFTNVDNPDLVIPKDRFVLASTIRDLANGFQNSVAFFVRIPDGTPAGRYRGQFTVADPTRPPTLNPNGEALRTDIVNVEIEVLAASALGLVDPIAAVELDSLVIEGRPGETRSGVARIANLGNVGLANVRVEATDLVATSGTGLRIRRDRLSFTPEQFSLIGIGDTARVVVTVRIPLGILAGRYTGELIVQADNVEETRIPLIVVVTTPGDIVFENNPVFGRNGDNAVIIFNADPGTQWLLRIFDMQAITTFAAEGTVFAGTPPPGGGDPTGGDQAIRHTWTLRNGRGENVAAGMYLVVIEATQAGQRRQLRGKLMVIR